MYFPLINGFLKKELHGYFIWKVRFDDSDSDGPTVGTVVVQKSDIGKFSVEMR